MPSNGEEKKNEWNAKTSNTLAVYLSASCSENVAIDAYCHRSLPANTEKMKSNSKQYKIGLFVVLYVCAMEAQDTVIKPR